MTTSEIESLFAQTLAGDPEDDDAWAAVAALRGDGSREIFDHAVSWCQSEDPFRRARAAAILSQLRAPWPGHREPQWMFRDESYILITRMLENEQNAVVLEAAVAGLGHLHNPEAIPLILSYQDHPDNDVRFSVAFALGCFPNEVQSVAGLLQLTRDADPHVRDWAVFGLGVLGDADSSEIRETLLRCLNDVDENVREEAAVGLGKRQDQRLIPWLRTTLKEPELKVRVAEAAAALLELKQDPPEWLATDYEVALGRKFDLQD
jgi:HEAT repeat protein